MAAPPKPASQITGVVHSLLDGLHSMSKSETVIGDAYTLGEATIVPVHRLRVALGAGGLHGGVKDDTRKGESGALGAGGAVQIEPVAVIAVGRDGVPRIMCVETQSDTAKKVMAQLPDMMGNIVKVLSERVSPLLGRLGQGPSAATVATVAASSPEPVKALPSGEGSDAG